MSNVSIERSIIIDAPREKVWQAITNPEQIVQWFVPNLPGAQMKHSEGGKVAVYLGEMGVDFMVLDINAPSHQATYRGLPDGLLFSTYSLKEEKDGTRVTVHMDGFDALPKDSRQDRIEHSSTGWENTLKNLKAYSEGTDLPFPQAFVGPLFGFWREDKKTISIERSIWMKASPQRVWQAITDPKQFQQWFSPNTDWQLSALEVGGRYYVYNEETKAETYVEVIEVLDPPNQLIMRHIPDPPNTLVTRTIYTLTEENNGTRLTLTNTGYEAEPVDTRWGPMEQNTFGYGMMLQNAKAFVEGQPLPFPWGF
jgi:uncharacterized protein YndB with AHSA1/START domain